MKNTDTQIPDDTEILQIHHLTDQEETNIIYSVESDTSELDARTSTKKRVLHLTQGTIDSDYDYEDDLFTIETTGRHQRVTFTEPHHAMGYYLHGIELAEYNEKEVHEKLSEDSSEIYNKYNNWVDNLTERDRKLRLMDLVEQRIEMDDIVSELYLTEYPGTWRTTNLSPEAKNIAREIKNSLDIDPHVCYRNAQQAALHFENNHLLNDRIKYVEGLVLPKTGGQAIKHAWLEIHGDVAELTWPWHRLDGADAVYFGREAESIEQVREVRESDLGGSIFLSESERKEMNNYRQQVHSGKTPTEIPSINKNE